ncbi:MAG: hypothetical protein CVT98_05165 [Bacteroidetes bacterium HGW-Bacteroidetes-15]|nr:MAG: hypothetical protein CVT98_05165 [Bacteroidetes bacterium HGW-Bacteroidetes-15]
MKYIIKLSLISIFVFLSIYASAQLFENIEQGTKSSYAPASVSLETGSWYFNDALVGTLANDKKNGYKSARFQNSGYIEMSFDYPNGMLEVSFYAANYGTTAGGSLQVSYSTNGGTSWDALGTQITLTGTLTQYTLSAGIQGNVRIRFTKTSGDRINVDDVLITDFIETNEEPTLAIQINDVPYENGATFDFGTNTGSGSASLKLRNTGDQDLIISSTEIIGGEFTVEGDLNITLSTLETATFPINFSSETPGVKTGSLTINSNDPLNGQFTINFTVETLDTSQPIPISEARNLPQGTLVTVTGWITAASQFAGPVYFQDETGGIAWYNDALMRQDWLLDAIIGDSIVVTGVLGNFYDLLQIINEVSYEIFHESNKEVDPLAVSLADLNSGNYEAMLVRIDDAEFSTTGVFSGGTNYPITDPSGGGQVRIDNYTNIPGTNIPNGISELTGIAGRYTITHQLLPRFSSDIADLSGPVILTIPPYEVSATANSITFEWETQEASHSEIRYGTTSTLEIGEVVDETPKTNHSITLSGLSPATAYKVQLRSAVETDTSTTAIYIASTSSPSGTTGEIFTFFNKDVDHSLATYREADENEDFSQKLIEYIQMAEHTAEFAFYSISGTVGSNVANAIIAAHNRGVDVRVIATGHTGTPNEMINYLASNGVKAVLSLGIEQMHNKFAVIDAHHTDPSKTWIITSSWNATDEGTYSQYQNMVIVQDVALARAYWYEFNQMWGGESGSFNSSSAKFGPNKSVVNPTVFWIGEDKVKVEAYFSPQANTEAKIIRALSSAEANIDLTLNLITRRTISTAMLSRFNEGVKVRGSIAVITGVGAEYDYLKTWADVHHFSQADFGLLHHKYAIVDGEATNSNSKVITGSHNWSANANFNNDENILIIHNPRIANEYFQEFASRYRQAGGEDEFNPSVSVGNIDNGLVPGRFSLQNYPNPFQVSTNIRFQLGSSQRVYLNVYDILGRNVSTLINGNSFSAGEYVVPFDSSNFSKGIYIYRLQLEDGRSISKSMAKVN